MAKKNSRNDKRVQRHARVRRDVFGTPEKPRLCVYRSLSNIFAQIIDDVSGNTLVAASTLDKEIKEQFANGGNKEAARAVGEAVVRERWKKASKRFALTEADSYITEE